MTVNWPAEIIEQLDWHWHAQLRPRLAGLGDEEYRWEPTPGAWTIHPDAGQEARIDWVYPPPDPAPVTTIAWRLAHIVIGCFGARSASHFGAPPVDYDTFAYARTADAALGQLDAAYAVWLAGVRGWADAGTMEQPLGLAEGHFASSPRGALVLHINREVIHHGAEIALLRDLWSHRS